MTPGKAKGGEYERAVCKRLSLWMSRGLRDDLFWRSAMSGGRATLRFAKGAYNKSQAGDVTAIDSHGERLTSKFLIECKFYKDLRILSLLLPQDDKSPKDTLADFWHQCSIDAGRAGRLPMLIAKQNQRGEFVLLSGRGKEAFMLPETTFFFHNGVYLYHFAAFLSLAGRP